MPKIKNVSPFGDLEVPMLGRVIEHGAIVDVTEEQAADLLRQEDNFKAWGEPAHKAKRKGERADERALDEQGVAPIAPPVQEDESK